MVTVMSAVALSPADVPLWLLVKRRFATRGAKVVRLPLILGLPGRLLGVYLHPANDVFRHNDTPLLVLVFDGHRHTDVGHLPKNLGVLISEHDTAIGDRRAY